jgi:hypothetical protein
MSIQPRIKTKQELYFEDKNNLDNEIAYKLKTFGLKQKYLLDMGYNNPRKIKNKIRQKFNDLILRLNVDYNMNFPYNIDNPYVHNNEFNNKFYDKEDISFYCIEHARVYRWLEIACDDILYLRDYLRKHCSANGMNSPHNKVNVWILSQVGSPYKAEKLLKYTNRHVKNLLDLFDFDHLYPNQLLIQQKIETKFVTKSKFYFNRYEILELAIGTIFSTYFYNLVNDYMYPNEYREEIQYTDEKEILKAKFVGEYIRDNLGSVGDYYYMNNEQMTRFGMFLSNLRNKHSNDYMTYLFRLL